MSHTYASVNARVVVVPPLALAALEVFHPHPHDLLQLELGRWMVVHYAQIVLFPLAAWSETELIRTRGGVAAVVCRLAMFVFAVTYVSFDTAAGVVTGVLVHAAQASGSPESWRPAILAVWNHPVIGGSSEGTPALAVIGTMAWLVGTLAAAVVVKQARFSWGPIVPLAISAFALLVFRTHAWPGGPIAFGALALAAALVLREQAARRDPR